MIKTTEEAKAAGYTDRYDAECESFDAEILVKPDTDFDTSFIAWSITDDTFIKINGWLWTFERVVD